MLNRLVMSLVAVLLVVGLVLAHGAPIVGTVTAVTDDNFTIKDKDNKSVVIGVEKATKYLVDEKPAKKTDLKVGVRVVIDAHQDAKTKSYLAEEVKIGVQEHSDPKPKAPIEKK